MTHLGTQFAPAERAPAKEVERQSREIQAVAMLRQVLDAVPEILLILNPQRQVVFVNQALLEFLGCKDPKSLYSARPGEILSCIHASETEGGCGTTEACRHCGLVLAIMASQQKGRGAGECRIARRSDGEALSLRVKASSFELKGQRFTIFSAVDISHEKRRQALERLLFGDFFQLSRGIQEAAVALPQISPDRLGHLIGDISQFSSRLLESINEYRILLAAECRELHLQFTSLSSMNLLQKLADYFSAQEIAQDRSIVLARPMQDISFTSDQTLLKLVLGHMVKNALEACQPQQIVTLNAVGTRDTIEFQVHNPTYMPREVQLQIFQLGYTTKGEGRGLGTYMMRLLSARYLKGKVSFVSTPNIGTTFKAVYPLELGGI